MNCWPMINGLISKWIRHRKHRVVVIGCLNSLLYATDMKEVQSGTKTCKRCKGSFATESNSSSACRFHPTYFVSRRHDDQKRYVSVSK